MNLKIHALHYHASTLLCKTQCVGPHEQFATRHYRIFQRTSQYPDHRNLSIKLYERLTKC